VSTLQRPKGNLTFGRHNMERWARSLIKFCLLELISVPHLINSRRTPSSSHLPPPLPEFTHFFCAKHASRRRSTAQNYAPPPSPRSFAPQCSTSSPSSITIPRAMAQNSAFPNPNSALSRLSYTPESSCRRPSRSSISAVCVSQIDGQFHLLAVFSRDWNVDEPRTR